MRFPFSKFMVSVLAGIALTSMALGLLAHDQSGWHPPDGTLWQSHVWLIEVPGGALGMEEWRLEGSNTETSVYLGSLHFSVLLPAVAVAAIGLGSLCALGLLCCIGYRTISQATEHDTYAA